MILKKKDKHMSDFEKKTSFFKSDDFNFFSTIIITLFQFFLSSFSYMMIWHNSRRSTAAPLLLRGAIDDTTALTSRAPETKTPFYYFLFATCAKCHLF